MRSIEDIRADIDVLFAAYIKLLMSIIEKFFPGEFKFYYLDSTGLNIYPSCFSTDIKAYIMLYCSTERDSQRIYITERVPYMNSKLTSFCIYDSDDSVGCSNVLDNKIKFNASMLRIVSNKEFIAEITEPLLEWKRKHIDLVNELSDAHHQKEKLTSG